MAQQGLVLIWLVGSTYAVSYMTMLTCPLSSKYLSLVKSRFGYFAMANLPFASISQVKLVQRQLAESCLQWGGPSLYQWAISLLLGIFFGLHLVAACRFVWFCGYKGRQRYGECVGCLRLP